MKQMATLISIGLLLVACQSAAPWAPHSTPTPQPTATPQPPPSLAHTEWALISLYGQPPLAGTHILLTFKDEQMVGFSGCNRYGGKYTVTAEGQLTFNEIAMTLMHCEDPAGVMDQEGTYLQALRDAAAYRLADDRLEVQNAAGETILIFARRPTYTGEPAALVGTIWRLVALDGQPPITGSVLTLAVHDERLMSGDAGCRDYLATYRAQGGDLTFDYTAMLGPLCPDEARQEQEGTYTTMLGWTTRYHLTPDRLELFTLRGETLTFEPLPAETWLALEGPTWTLLAFVQPNPEDEAIPLPTELLDGSEITARFAGGEVRGSAGCNRYHGSYTRRGDALILGPVAATEMACFEPAGVMDQEVRFLDLLARVAGYHIYGDRLWLGTDDGQILIFRALNE